MALFKISKGQSKNLPKTYNEGYAYFTTDDGKFYIDTSDLADGRIGLNAFKSDEDRLGNIIDETYITAEENAIITGPIPKINAETLGGKEPEYYIQPRNLLDNSDFTNPVNQRGQTSYTKIGHTIDRWYKENFSVLTVNDACTIDNTANSAYEVILQKTDEKTALSLLGKTVTLAMCLTDGTIYCNSGVVAYDNQIATTQTNDFVLCLHFFQESQSYQLARLVILPKGKSISVKWIALYEGEYTVETLPPYVPKGYGAELAECQRYYQVIKNGMGSVRTNEDKILVTLPLCIPMRNGISVASTTITAIRANGQRIDNPEIEISTVSYNNFYSACVVELSGTFTDMGNFIAYIDGTFHLSADL